MSMPPIKFESIDGEWIGVGNLVYACDYHNEPKRGCVTGFSRDIDDATDNIIRIEITIPPTEGPSSVFRRVSEVKDFEYQDVFATEQACWLRYANLLDERRVEELRLASVHQDRAGEHAHSISVIRGKWSRP